MVLLDASKYGIAHVIAQHDKQGVLRPVAVRHRSFSPDERKWSTVEQELYALLYFVEETSKLIESCEVFVLSDHANLTQDTLVSLLSN